MTSQDYPVYKLEVGSAAGTKHSALYVDTGSTPGQLLHVRCAVGKTGMMFERQYYVGHGPEALSTFLNKTRIGSVKMEDVERLAEICGDINAPISQYVNNACQCATWVHEARMAAEGAGVLF